MTNREKCIDNASDKELAEIIGKSASVHKNELILFGDGLEVDEIEKWLSQEVEEDKIITNNYEKFNEVKITVNAWNELIDKLRELNVRLDKLEKCNRIAEVKEHIEEKLEEETKDMVKNKNMRPMTKEDAEELIDKIGRCSEEVKQMNKTNDEIFEDVVKNSRPATKEEKDWAYEQMINTSRKTGVNISDLVDNKSADEMFEELGYEIVDGSIPNIQYCKIDEGRKVVIELNRYVHIKYFSDFDIRDISFINEAEDKAIHKKIEELKNEKKNISRA